MTEWQRSGLVFLALFGLGGGPPTIPHGQSRDPGDPLSPAEAVKAMTVPEGFKVEVVASEPDLVNPVAMTFDERGRAWVTESLEYPRREPGHGRDRVKVLEDSDGNGTFDRSHIFADGLNIPSGIAIGHGGVWVANSPDILFFRDLDGDGKADSREVVVTGFGRSDTHELPNSLSWGPDGWLYGWNGVFNPSHVEYRGKTYNFTCAIFRIHPRTREFELFCEGTSNPWGLAWDDQGSAFASACVIEHLWHLTETGYYHRQGGPYPPFTWKIESIVQHRHQQAAYCGLHYYESDAYPERYRGKLFMGNIHGNGINVDRLRRSGSTYTADAEPDFLRANDAWFMPVVQKTGPDGSLYILDWYDRYHCYQDANRDPAGIDRFKGRLYRVRYKETPYRWGFDLAQESDAQLIARLKSPNGYDREVARRLLAERTGKETDDLLRSLALDPQASRANRMTALWTRISRATPDQDFLKTLMTDPDPGFRAWGVRASGNLRRVEPSVRDQVIALANDASPDVQLHVAIASRKIEGIEPVALLTAIASTCGNDSLIPHIVWQNLLPLLETQSRQFMTYVDRIGEKPGPGLIAILPRALERLLQLPKPDAKAISNLLGRLIAMRKVDEARQGIAALTARIRDRSLSKETVKQIGLELAKEAVPVMNGEGNVPLSRELFILYMYFGDFHGLSASRVYTRDPSMPDDVRIRAFEAIAFMTSPEFAVDWTDKLLKVGAKLGSVEFRGRLIASLGTVDDPGVARTLIDHYANMEPNLRPRAIELLTQRPAWGLALLNAIGEGKVDSNALNVNQIRKLLASNDANVAALVKARYGTVREGRNPSRERVIGEVREALRKTPGDPVAGVEVFKRLCAQCHKIYGEGQDVGPEITLNGRGSYEQLLSNVFDPSLVIGTAYQGTTVATADGRVLTGLLVEQGPQQVVLKLQGGKTESIPRGQVEALKVSPLSLMPEDLEKQLKPQELADLFAFITLDKAPSDPSARPIPGAQEIPRKSGTR